MFTVFPLSRLPLAAALLVGACAAPAHATEPPASATPEHTIVGYRTLWELQGEARARPQRFQIDALVHYYDPEWRQLWGQDGDRTFYLVPPAPLPIRSGQRVRLSGVSRPEKFWAVEELSAVVLEEHPVITPIPVRGPLTEVARLDERFLEIEGVVDSQRLVDTTHLRLLLLADGLRIDTVVRLEGNNTVPDYAGVPVRVRGVYHADKDAEGRLQGIELSVPGLEWVEPMGAGARRTAPSPAPADQVDTTEQSEPIVGYQNLVHLHGRAYEQPQRFQIDATVLHYDPHWRQLWAQEGEATFFLIAPAQRLPIQAGQFVRLEGITIPASLSQVLQLQATVIGTEARPGPLPARGRLHDFAALNERLVRLEGYVESQSLVDRNHLRCELVSEGLRAEMFLLLEAENAAPSLVGQVVDVQGVYGGKRRPDGQLDSFTLIVPGPDRIIAAYPLRDDPRFAAPPVPIEQLPQAPAASWQHIAGRVVGVVPGVSVTLRDETGQVDVLTPQQHQLQIGAGAAAVGQPAVEGTRWLLRRALVRGEQALPERTAGGPPRLLRLARQVHELAPSAAQGGHPVQLQGVVTWSAPGTRFLFLQDSSGGVRVRWADPTLAAPPPGAGLSVRGQSIAGEFAPEVQATRFVPQYTMNLPEPHEITFEEALSGLHEATWVELKGLLSSVGTEGPRVLLRLATATGEFEAIAPPDDSYATKLGSFVAVRGVYEGQANPQHQLTGIRLWAPTSGDVVVEEAPPDDPFALPDQPIASLRQFGLRQRTTHWIRTSGTVVYHVPGRDVIIQDGPDSLIVSPIIDDTIPVGERIEVVGVHGRDNHRLVLHHAEVRRLGPGPPVSPQPLDSPFPLQAELDSRVVRLFGTLGEVIELHGEQVLEVRNATDTLIGRLAGTTGDRVPRRWRRGSEVELTGIYRLKLDEHHRRTGFEVLLRRPEDLRILRRAPVWTSQRARSIALLALAGLVAAGLWVVALRRRLRQQTERLRQQLDKEAELEAEIERARRAEALGELAGGIAHDFNNLLTAIHGNLSFSLLDQRVAALAGESLTEAQASAERARDLVQQMLTFARGGEPIREAFALEPLVRESVTLALSGSAVQASVSAEADLPEVWGDRLQVRRALLNLLTHGLSALPGGGTVSLRLAVEAVPPGAAGPLAPGTYLRIEISDSGEAIPADRLASLFDPYAGAAGAPPAERFGMATAFSIAQKHGGHLRVRSRADEGTTFTLWLPAAQPGLAGAATRVPARTAPARTPVRILLMDDEPALRLKGERLLRHLGHEPTAVADGDACVEAYRAAIDQRRPFALVILDLTVAGAGGARETLAELRKTDPLVCAIVSSGFADNPVLAHHREHGFAAAVSKPYELEQLAAAIDAALDEDLVL